MRIAGQAAQWNPAGRDPTDWWEKSKLKAKYAKGDEPQGMAVGLPYQTAERQPEAPQGC